MTMSGAYRIAAPQERVWAALHDPEILRHTIPGCLSVRRLSSVELALAVLPPDQGEHPFRGRLVLSDPVPLSRCTITLLNDTDGAAAMLARIAIQLAADGADSTRLSYQADPAAILDDVPGLCHGLADTIGANLGALLAPGAGTGAADDDVDGAATELLVKTAEEMEARPEVPSSAMPDFASVPLAGRPDLAGTRAADMARLAEPHHRLEEDDAPVAAPEGSGLGPLGWVSLIVVVLLIMVLLTTLG